MYKASIFLLDVFFVFYFLFFIFFQSSNNVRNFSFSFLTQLYNVLTIHTQGSFGFPILRSQTLSVLPPPLSQHASRNPALTFRIATHDPGRDISRKRCTFMQNRRPRLTASASNSAGASPPSPRGHPHPVPVVPATFLETPREGDDAGDRAVLAAELLRKSPEVMGSGAAKELFSIAMYALLPRAEETTSLRRRHLANSFVADGKIK